jgi:hypothetical protein
VASYTGIKKEIKGRHFSRFQNGALKIIKSFEVWDFKGNCPYFPTFLNKLPIPSLIFF